MTIEEIRAAMIGKRLQTLYHGQLQTDWGKIVNVLPVWDRDVYWIHVDSEPYGHYVTPDIIETLCRDGIAEKTNEWGKQYKLAEVEESLK